MKIYVIIIVFQHVYVHALSATLFSIVIDDTLKQLELRGSTSTRLK
jgi:hypothetical protein